MILLSRIGLTLLLLSALAGTLHAGVITITGSSMSPTLSPGDRVTVESVSPSTLQKGDLVALSSGAEENPVVIRVVAVPGDRVGVKNGALTVNATTLRKVNFQLWKSTMKRLEYSRWVVPGDNLLVLGDNPLSRQDDARLALVPTSQVTGKVTKIDKVVPSPPGK